MTKRPPLSRTDRQTSGPVQRQSPASREYQTAISWRFHSARLCRMLRTCVWTVRLEITNRRAMSGLLHP